MDQHSEPNATRGTNGDSETNRPGKIRRRSRIQGWGSGRKNISRACDLCKMSVEIPPSSLNMTEILLTKTDRKKIRCSGSQPCSRCVQHRLSCAYTLPHLRGRHPQLPRPLETPTYPANASSDGNQDSVERGRLHHREDLTAVGESPTQSPSRGVINHDSQYLGPTAGETFISRAWRRIRRDHYMTQISPTQTDPLSPVVNTIAPNDEPPTLTQMTATPPQISHQQATDLVQFYFDVAVISYRFLNSKLVIGWVVELYSGYSTALDGHVDWQKLGPYKSSILFMIFATSLHYQEVSGRVAMNGSRLSRAYLAAARQSLKKQKHQHRLETVQARLAYSIYLLATSKLEVSWYVLGRTVQVMTALGMHRKGHEPPSSTLIEIQLTRRCYWTAYALDRYVSVILGRPRLIFDDLFDTPFPERVDDDNPQLVLSDWATSPSFGLNCRFDSAADCSMDAPYFTHRLAHIMGEISFGIYPLKGTSRDAQFENSKLFTAKLTELWKELPPSLGVVHPDSLSPVLRRRTIELRVSFNHAIVLANRPYLLGRSDFDVRGLGTDNVANPYAEQAQKGVHAARTVVNLWVKVAEDRNIFGAFWIVHHAVFSAISVMYLYIILSSRSGPGLSESDEEVFLLAQQGQRHLGTAAAVNRMCIRYCSILEELREEATKQPASSGTNAPFLLVSGDQQALDDSSNNHPAGLGLDTVIAVSDEQLRPTVGTGEDGGLIGDWSIFDSLISFNPESVGLEIP